MPYLLLSAGASTITSPRVTRLHLKHRLEEVFRGGGEELYLSIGVQAVQIGGLWGQALVYVVVVALVVCVGWDGEARR